MNDRGINISSSTHRIHKIFHMNSAYNTSLQKKCKPHEYYTPLFKLFKYKFIIQLNCSNKGTRGNTRTSQSSRSSSKVQKDYIVTKKKKKNEYQDYLIKVLVDNILNGYNHTFLISPFSFIFFAVSITTLFPISQGKTQE